MALPVSGTLSLLDIQNEFGGSNPINLSEYYRGGANVPNVAVNYSIPLSGTISISDFYGAANETFNSFTVDYSGSEYNACNFPSSKTVYQSGIEFNLSTNIYSNATGTSLASAAYYVDYSLNVRYWNGYSWTGTASSCFSGGGGNGGGFGGGGGGGGW
ncbi:MAG: hypothetical protein P8I94_04960 [Emcibacteraceae bacterium]|nr:hypothetical protein [Emcibacteraceae bacterium]